MSLPTKSNRRRSPPKIVPRPAFLFDGRNILDHRRLFKLGFNVFAIGKAPLKHF